MQSTATKLRIKFNRIRRAARWKKPNARYILIGRDLREPTPVPWEPAIEEHYKDIADFMKRGWDKGHVYAFPMRGRQPGQLYRDLMGSLTLNPFEPMTGSIASRKQMLDVSGQRKAMFEAHLESHPLHIPIRDDIGELTPEQLDSIHLTGDIVNEVTKLQAADHVRELEEKGVTIVPQNDIHLAHILKPLGEGDIQNVQATGKITEIPAGEDGWKLPRLKLESDKDGE